MQGFQIEKNDTTSLYKYRCVYNLALLNDTINHHTPMSKIVGNDWAVALSSISVNCGDNFGLQQFKLNSQQDGIFYSFRCVYALVDKCNNGTTQEIPVTESLMNLPFLLNENQIISWFKYVYSNTTNGISLKYGACDLTDMVAKAESTAQIAQQIADQKVAEQAREKIILEEKQANYIAAQKVFNKTNEDLLEALNQYENATIIANQTAEAAQKRAQDVTLTKKRAHELRALTSGFFNKVSYILVTLSIAMLLV